MTDLSIPCRTEKFCRELPGVKNIYERIPTFRKASWVVICVVISGLCVYQFMENTIEFFGYPVTTRISVKYDDAAPFPFVTICNLNILKRSKSDFLGPKLRQFWLNGDKFAARQLPSKGQQQRTTTNVVMMRDLLYASIYENGINTTDGFGHMPELMVQACTYQGKPCGHDDFFLWQHSSFGNCLTLNASVIVGDSTKSSPGKDFGLRLELYAEKAEYISALTPAVGFQVEIHDPDIVPVPELNGFTVSTGFATSIGLHIWSKEQARFLDKLAEHLGRAGGSLRYSQRKCLRMCTWSTVIANCNCVNPFHVTREISYLTMDRLIPACDPYDTSQRKCFEDALNNTRACEAMCPPPCLDVQYVKSVTTSVWPSDEYIQASLPIWKSEITGLREVLNKGSSDVNSLGLTGPILTLANEVVVMQQVEMIKQNLARVDVFFEELNYQIISEEKKLTFIDLAVNFGGTLGLWVGMCVFNMVEILEYLFDISLIAFRKRKPKILEVDEKRNATIQDLSVSPYLSG